MRLKTSLAILVPIAILLALVAWLYRAYDGSYGPRVRQLRIGQGVILRRGGRGAGHPEIAGGTRARVVAEPAIDDDAALGGFGRMMRIEVVGGPAKGLEIPIRRDEIEPLDAD